MSGQTWRTACSRNRVVRGTDGSPLLPASQGEVYREFWIEGRETGSRGLWRSCGEVGVRHECRRTGRRAHRVVSVRRPRNAIAMLLDPLMGTVRGTRSFNSPRTRRNHHRRTPRTFELERMPSMSRPAGRPSTSAGRRSQPEPRRRRGRRPTGAPIRIGARPAPSAECPGSPAKSGSGWGVEQGDNCGTAV